MLSLFPVLFHRIGLIILVVSATVLLLLPKIYPYEEDTAFIQRLSHILIHACRVGEVLLIITGTIRLLEGIPLLFLLKAIAAVITFYWTFIELPSYPSEAYQKSHLIHLMLVCLTAVVGILL